MNDRDKAKLKEQQEQEKLFHSTRKNWEQAHKILEREPLNRRCPDNNLRRAVQDSERQENARVSRWMRLADVMFGRGGDDDATPSAA